MNDKKQTKLPENMVVLTREEYNKLLNVVEMIGKETLLQTRKETLDEVYAIVWKEKFRAGGQKARLLGAILDLYEPKKSPYETILDEVRKETAREILQWLIEHTFESCIFETYFREQYGVEIE